MRKIPATMATQHPDNALPPYWDKKGEAFISVYQEITEAIACFQDLGVSEYMWDWEGKHADSAVIDRLFSEYHEYFSTHQLGRDKFLTFRIPNIWEEKGYNLLQAMTVILSSEDFARDLDFQQRPLFEVILPMTERPEQLMRIHKLFQKLAQFKNTDFTKREPDNNDYLELIPLVESVESQLGVGTLLTDYVRLHEEHFGHQPAYLRPFFAGSDSALAAGLLAGIIGNKVGLSRAYEFSKESGIPVYPIFGCGSLLFRGGLAPNDQEIDRFLQEFPGIRTVTTQSSFRYDHPIGTVKAAIRRLEAELPTVQPRIIPVDQQKRLVRIAETAAANYKQTIAAIAGDMQEIFTAVPKRRDRRQHIGLLAYSRSLGEQTLPRAITFTAGFYSVGVPPEFIGFGRALKDLSGEGLALLREAYPNMTADFKAAGGYLCRENLHILAKRHTAWQEVMTDITLAEEILGVTFVPQTDDEKEHAKLAGELLAAADSGERTTLITRMAALRESLG